MPRMGKSLRNRGQHDVQVKECKESHCKGETRTNALPRSTLTESVETRVLSIETVEVLCIFGYLIATLSTLISSMSNMFPGTKHPRDIRVWRQYSPSQLQTLRPCCSNVDGAISAAISYQTRDLW